MNEAILLNRIPDLKKVHLFEELESTNDLGKTLLADSSIELPALIYTSKQTRGRGRNGKSWISSPGSLTFSFLVDSRSTQSLPHESLIWGLAVANALNSLTPETCPLLSVKWPNDVMADEKKIAGILIESTARSTQGRVVGIGINLSNSPSRVPDSTGRLNAISVEELTGKQLDVVDVLTAVWNLWNQFRKMQNELIIDSFAQCDFLKTRQIQFECGDLCISGNYQGIDSRGAIQIHTGSQLKTFASGSITGFGPPQKQRSS
ncbi:MAG: biotin--[acetyl-CoA-carboxylase] ligase [Planctomycetota bacterium]|nr:biotin--[acetyl-CoA-carboxylase] ligase [Planctomycetota bacterium]